MEDYERLWGRCRELKDAFNGQRPGSVVFEQWLKTMLDTRDERKDTGGKSFFGLF